MNSNELELLEEIDRKLNLLLRKPRVSTAERENVVAEVYPRIPPGWEAPKAGDFIADGDYMRVLLDGASYVKCTDDIGKMVFTSSRFFYIRQKINIDLSKQPEELNCWAMDKKGNWWGYDSYTRCGERTWSRIEYTPESLHLRKLYRSECPTFTGNWEDSLLVRPEYWNKICTQPK